MSVISRFAFAAALLAAWPVAAVENPVSVAAIAPVPEGEALSEWYTVRVGGREVPVYECRVSAVPFNQVWPGYQRPLDQTETAGFATWDQTGLVAVEVTSQRPIETVAIKPDRLRIVPRVEGDRITFEVAEPTPLVVEVNGKQHALHLFACPPVEAPPAPGENVLIFGPGVHRPGQIHLRSGQTVYLAPGAVVYGSLHGQGVRDVRVYGRGVIDQSPFPRGEAGGSIRLMDCSDIRIEGIICRDPDVWCCTLLRCERVAIHGLKAVGLWRYNADGIDVCNSRDVTVEECFVRAFDDALVVKGLKLGPNPGDDPSVERVTFRRCVVWCDWGRNLEIGAETCAPEIAEVLFEDIDCIHSTHIAMDVQHGDRATVRDITFRDIRIDLAGWNPHPAMQQAPGESFTDRGGWLPQAAVIVIRHTMWSKDEVCGTARNIAFREIAVIADQMPASALSGADPEHDVRGVTFAGWSLNGQPLASLEAMRVWLGDHVAEVTVEP